jgi:SAM-dependent methyltransferase
MLKRARLELASDAAATYQRELLPALFGPWGSRVVELAALRPGLRVLDVACGTGLVARLAAEAVGTDGRVTALDLNPAMLAVASELPAVEAPRSSGSRGTRRRCRSQGRPSTLSPASSGFSSLLIERPPYVK